MTESSHDDPSPLASLICGGHLTAPAGFEVARPEGTDDWSLVLTLKGSGRYFVPSGRHLFMHTHPRQLVLIPPGTPHACRTSTTWDHLWVHFRARPHWQDWLDWPQNDFGLSGFQLPTGRSARTVQTLMREVIDLTMEHTDDRELFAMNALEALFLQVRRLRPESLPAADDHHIQMCIDYIGKHFAEPITLAELARISGQSVSRISHRFKAQTGLSPMHYVEERRMTRAIQLLQSTQMAIKEIAFAVGYEEPFYFTTRFKRYSGFSPRAFRARTAHPTRILRRPGVALNPEDQKAVEKGE